MDDDGGPSPSGRLPAALVVVAWLLILFGASAGLEMIAKWAHGFLSVNLGVLQIPIGIGLLRRRPLARTIALVCTVLALVISPIVAILVLSAGGPGRFTVFGFPVASVGSEVMLAFMAAGFLFFLWQLSVLRRQSVRDLFRR